MEPKLLRIGIGNKTTSLVSAWSPQRNPIALSVCAESHARALGFYTLKVPIYKYHELSALRFAVRYIDPEHDLVLVDPSFRSETSSNWGRMNGDFNDLKSSIFNVKDVVGYSDVRIKTAIRRLALPRRWWQFRCLAGKGDTHGYLWAFAHSFFTDFREIYIIQDFEEEPRQQHSKVSGCTANLDSLLPISIRADLQRIDGTSN